MGRGTGKEGAALEFAESNGNVGDAIEYGGWAKCSNTHTRTKLGWRELTFVPPFVLRGSSFFTFLLCSLCFGRSGFALSFVAFPGLRGGVVG